MSGIFFAKPSINDVFPVPDFPTMITLLHFLREKIFSILKISFSLPTIESILPISASLFKFLQ